MIGALKIGDGQSTSLEALVMSKMMIEGSRSGSAQADKIVALGTSLTTRGGWQEPLASALSQGAAKEPEVVLVARPGATSQWGRAQIDRVRSEKPDVVLLEFAVNDAAIHNLVSLEQSSENMSAIIGALRAAGKPPRIYVMAMNPVHGLKRWTRLFLARYEEAHRDVARDLGVGFIDHRAAWAKLPEAERLSLIPDGLHPDPEAAHRIIVPNILDALEGADPEQASPPWRH